MQFENIAREPINSVNKLQETHYEPALSTAKEKNYAEPSPFDLEILKSVKQPDEFDDDDHFFKNL